MSELKPCPFCGGEAFYDMRLNKFDVFEGNVACDCGMRGIDCKESRFDCMDEDQLKSALSEHWNNRPYENKIKADAYRDVGEVLKYEYEGSYDQGSIEDFFDDRADKLEEV